MNPTFRVEAFIVPILNREDDNDDNIIDDVKVANKIKDVIESPKAIGWIHNSGTDDKETDNCTTSGNIQSCNSKSNNCLPIIKIDHFISEESDEENQGQEEDSGEKKEVTVQKDECKINIELNTVVEEPIYDVPYALLNADKLESVKLRERFETDEYVTMKIIPKDNVKLGKVLMRTSSLMSIDERGETPEDCNDEFCCHGYKNGCTVKTQRPEAVTEEIFEVNWMKRLEQLRAREAIIKDKEAVLFDRERLLFRKERELRILERLIKDKLKHAELYIKRCKSKNNDAIDCDIMSKISEQSKDSQSSKDNGTVDRLNSIESLESCHKIGNDVHNKKITGELIPRDASKCNGSLNTKVILTSERILKNPPNSRSSLVTSASIPYQAPKSDVASSYLTSRNAFGGLSGYSSLRIKKRPKVTYDDLDSTLSADIGDSSFVVTSKKFDPEIFKKPNAFTRSCSERRRSRIISERPSTAATDVAVHPIEEDKLLKRMSANILVSHDKNTKFQHYGLIDTGTNQQCEANSDSDNNKRHSYLDLEDGKKSKKNPFRSKNKKNNSKERPVSWNEETNEWLQKKRLAYNLQTAKKISTGDIYNNNKENHDSQLKLNQMQKKVSKGIKFSIFR